MVEGSKATFNQVTEGSRPRTGKYFSIKNYCVGFSEIDPHATKTYKANFNTENEIEIGDIVKFTSDQKNIEALKDFSILTGGQFRLVRPIFETIG